MILVAIGDNGTEALLQPQGEGDCAAGTAVVAEGRVAVPPAPPPAAAGGKKAVAHGLVDIKVVQDAQLCVDGGVARMGTLPLSAGTWKIGAKGITKATVK
eukprot:TRINITY_DN1334_c0_g1_i1.p2 TRINITY_DN1334_c0_g1~~TRINITY_DN1334_c0_g1_i1.p2  ORF type:complete len:100 (-),score=30.48 TRINITY_DN1334_c0_g1_i1:64-363(-)